MGAIYVRSCDDLPYGPGQSDYEYDKERQRKDDMEPMSDLGKHLFDQMTAINESQRIAMRLGRQQVARDVAAWAARNAEHIKDAQVESLLAICNKELT